MNETIDEYLAKTQELVDVEVDGEARWNSCVNADQSRHFLNGLSDINPRWQPSGPGDEVHPLFLTSVVYPQMHGETMAAPLTFLMGGVKYKWDAPIHVGDDLDGTAKIKDVFEKGDGEKKRYIFVIAEVTYTRDGEKIATAEGTMIRLSEAVMDGSIADKEVYSYSADEREEIMDLYDQEIARLEAVPEAPSFEDLSVGDTLPTVVRGPLTIADMVCWNASRGPSFGAGIINYQERKAQPFKGFTLNHPITGWMQKRSHQHTDPWLAEENNMPLPFANGVMMYSWSSPLTTNWMGSDGFLKSYEGKLESPYYYGDTLWLDGEITDRNAGDDPSVEVEWEAVNQYDEAVVSGTSEVAFPGQ